MTTLEVVAGILACVMIALLIMAIAEMDRRGL